MTQSLAAALEHRAHVLARVKKVLIESLHVPRAPEEIEPDAPLFGTGLSLDSVDAVELVVSLETEFGFRLDDDLSARLSMRTVNTVVDLALRKLGGPHVAA